MVRRGRRLLSRRRLALSAALSAALVLLAACEAERPAAPAERVRPVRYAVVTADAGTLTRTFSGAAQADVEAQLSFRVGGALSARAVDVGDTVAPGALIAQLDQRDYQVRVREAEAQLSNARAGLRNAEANYARARNLYENDNVALSELDGARAAAESAAAQVSIAQQNLADARLKLSYTRLGAPARCDVADVFVKENENVAAGQPIVRLSCGGCPEVKVSVPETQIEGVVVGDAVTVSFPALPGQAFAAQVSEVGVATTTSATAFPVVARLDGACEAVRPGMAADVAFTFSAPGTAGVTVPLVAVSEDRDGRYVYVLEQVDATRWRARRRAVATGPPQATGIPVTDGLASGERIVTAGVRRISDGMLVRLYDGAD
ncbi:MAG: efflux RND transporter periplasmic adaptor subunit [Gammaproteobacteria bacterium]